MIFSHLSPFYPSPERTLKNRAEESRIPAGRMRSGTWRRRRKEKRNRRKTENRKGRGKKMKRMRKRATWSWSSATLTLCSLSCQSWVTTTWRVSTEGPGSEVNPQPQFYVSRVVECVFSRCERLLINSDMDICLLCSLQAAQTSLRRSWLRMRNWEPPCESSFGCSGDFPKRFQTYLFITVFWSVMKKRDNHPFFLPFYGLVS